MTTEPTATPIPMIPHIINRKVRIHTTGSTLILEVILRGKIMSILLAQPIILVHQLARTAISGGHHTDQNREVVLLINVERDLILEKEKAMTVIDIIELEAVLLQNVKNIHPVTGLAPALIRTLVINTEGTLNLVILPRLKDLTRKYHLKVEIGH